MLDAGITMIDTSPDYGGSEELHRRVHLAPSDRVLPRPKCGCPVDPPPGERPPHVFTRANVRAGVEQSLRRMKTDHLDLVQFHISPSRAELEANDSVAELVALKRRGQGPLHRHVGHAAEPHRPHRDGRLRRLPDPLFGAGARARGVDRRCGGGGGRDDHPRRRGARHPGQRGQALERLPERFRQAYAKRRDLWDEARLDEVADGMPRMEFMLRFTISHPDMTTTIVGTANPQHLADNVAAAKKGPLPADQVAEAKRRLDAATAAHAAA